MLFTGTSSTSTQNDGDIPQAAERVLAYGAIFSEAAQGVVHALQGHTDMDCKDLAARLNFNRHYSQTKEKEKEQPKGG